MTKLSVTLPLALATLAAACSDDGGTTNAEEVINTITLTFTPATGAPRVAVWNDADGDGGAAPTIDSIGLLAGTTYATTVRFQNTLEAPPEEITDEVRDEGDQHQVFFTGTAVNGPASNQPTAALTHTYGDVDVGGLPIGLTNTIVVASGAGGDLVLTLRHLPPVNGTPVKTAAAAMTVRDSGFTALGGENDAQVTFPVAIAAP